MSARATGVTKSFGDLRALRGVSLEIASGEVHALLGANGSGKSTLSKCLCGAYQPDTGTLLVGDVETSAFATPLDAGDAGVRVVHQDSPLINSMSIAENFALARGYPRQGGRIQWRKLREATRTALERVGVRTDPNVLAGDLHPADRATVSLALALHDMDSGVELLILDEVTASIPEDDALRFLDQVRLLPEMGVPILMVTHRFKEVAAYTDTVTILSDGEVVHNGPSSAVTTAELVDFMTAASASGSEQAKAVEASHVEERVHIDTLEHLWNADAVAPSPGVPAIAVENLVGEFLEDVSFSVSPGEILGIAGLPESGIHELPEILAGGRHRRSGAVAVAGSELPVKATPIDAIERGLVSAPRDRRREGGAMSLTVRENMTLPVARRFWGKRKQERAVVKKFMEAFDVRPPQPAAMFGTLSGGNQQKVVVAKWLITEPKVLVLDDPTAGVDPGARRQLFLILHEAAARGLGLIIFSTEPEQLAEHCSRVVVLGGGRVVAELSGDQLDKATINQQVITLSSV